jgi:hypothetical protein
MRLAVRFLAAAFAAALVFVLFAPACVFADFTAYPMSRQFPEDSVATYTVDSESAYATFSWYLKFDGNTYDFANLDLSSAQWINYVTGFGVSADGKTLFFEGVTKDLGGAEVYCVCDENGVKTTSPAAVVSICEAGMPMPPVMKAPAKVTATCGEKAVLSVEAEPQEGVTYNYQWYTSFSENLADIKAIMDDGFDGPSIEISSDAPGTVNYCCMVESVKDGKSTNSYTNIIQVEFKAAAPVETEAPSDDPSTPTDEPVNPTEAPATETPGWEPPEGKIEISSAQLAMICLTVVVAILAIAVIIVVIILLTKKK